MPVLPRLIVAIKTVLQVEHLFHISDLLMRWDEEATVLWILKRIKHFVIPIGQLTEDVQECQHKDIKRYREHFSRKMSRKVTNTDIMNNLLISSDPLISSYRPLPEKQKTPSESVRKLLVMPGVQDSEEESDDFGLSDLSI